MNNYFIFVAGMCLENWSYVLYKYIYFCSLIYFITASQLTIFVSKHFLKFDI